MSNSSASLVLIDCIKIDNEIFNQLIQDKGVGPEDEQFDKIKSKVFKKAPDKRKYKDLWKLSKTFVDKMKLNKDRFQRYPCNSDDAAVIRKINGIIFSLRDNREGVFILHQSSVHTKLASMWGEDNEADGPTMSDKARIFGLITSEKYRDEVKIF